MDRTTFIKQNIRGKVLDIGSTEGVLHQLIFKKNMYSLDLLVPKDTRNFIRGDAMFLPFKNNSFNSIVAGELIEHLHNPSQFLRECKRVLRKNGVLIISTPNRESWINRVFKSYEHNAHLSLFNISSLKKLISRFFTLEEIFLLPYDEISAWGSRHKKFYWLRKMTHNFLPQNLQEEIIIKAVK